MAGTETAEVNGILMVADKFLLTKKHPVVDPLKGSVDKWRTGTVKEGEQFVHRGPPETAPSAAHAVDPKDQERIEQAKAKKIEDDEIARQAKQMKANAMAAAAAAAAFQGAEQHVPAPEPTPAVPPKRKPGRPKGSKNKPKADAAEAVQ